METVDVEKQYRTRQTPLDSESVESNGRKTGVPQIDLGEARVNAIRKNNAVLRFLSSLETRIGTLATFEARGVERIPEDQRRPPQKLNMIFFWFAVLLSPTLIPIGMLGPIFGLSVNTSIILTVFSTLIGSTFPAFTATLSPLTGLRQIAIARYSMGLWGARLSAVLNVVINVGYAIIAAIVGGQLLRAVSGGGLSLAVGIVIVIVIAYVVSFFGYRVIHHYHRYAWIFAFILLCALYGQSHKYFSPSPGVSIDTGITYSGACLSYFAIIFGVCASWCPISGDYYVHYPVNTSRWLVFGLTYIGIILPTIFVGILGNYFGGITSAHQELDYIYKTGGVGALILQVMTPPAAWGKFACVFFTLSFLADVICNIYSSALSIQLLGEHFVATPRYVLCTVLSLVIFALAYGGRHVLESILNNLLPILGYWTLAFAVIIFIEHFVFRPRLGGYDLSAWQDPKRLPIGLAGTGSLLIGIGFSFLGMCQTWYIAPIAKPIGKDGGDVGDELTLVSVLVSYLILRQFEIKYTGR
ncbi:hypothetical protein DV736_g3788, partial [Chaetothyriales sp. CBS 134916]